MPSSEKRLCRGYTKFDITVDEGNEPRWTLARDIGRSKLRKEGGVLKEQEMLERLFRGVEFPPL